MVIKLGSLQILVGDITSNNILEGHDAIVNATNPAMMHGGGVCGAIFDKAGSRELTKILWMWFSNRRIKENLS